MDQQELKAALEASDNKACRYFAGNAFVLSNSRNIRNVKTKRGESKNSYRFVSHTQSVCDTLRSIFKLEVEPFVAKFERAISGDGQEEKRIDRLASSSLLALLCFHRVSKEHKLKLRLNGKDYLFNEVDFECKNPISKGSDKCSNVDVVLVGPKAKLYLESKFGEYFSRSSDYTDISEEAYGVLYREFFKRDWETLKCSFGDAIAISSNDGKPHYCSGIKQMISHYQGLRTLLSGNEAAGKQGKEIFLGTILFDGFGGKLDRKHQHFDDYVKCYGEFLKNAPRGKDGFKLVDKILTYQDVFDGTEVNRSLLPARVRQFYFAK